MNLSCKRRKVCSPKTGTASSSRGSTDASLNTNPCSSHSDFSDPLSNGHIKISSPVLLPYAAPRGSAKCSMNSTNLNAGIDSLFLTSKPKSLDIASDAPT